MFSLLLRDRLHTSSDRALTLLYIGIGIINRGSDFMFLSGEAFGSYEDLGVGSTATMTSQRYYIERNV